MPFRLLSLTRAKNAAKRLKKVHDLCLLRGLAPGDERPLAFHRHVLARLLGHPDWPALETATPADDADPLDADLAPAERLLDRRLAQADLLAESWGVDHRAALDAINDAEPTGNGSGCFAVDPGEETPTLLYRLPDLPVRDGLVIPLFPEAEDESTAISAYYAPAIVNADGGFEQGGPLFVEQGLHPANIEVVPLRTATEWDQALALLGSRALARLEREVPGLRRPPARERWLLRTASRTLGVVCFERSARGHAFHDEPRLLKAQEVESVDLEWSIHLVAAATGVKTREFADGLGVILGTLMLQDMIWLATPPRPTIEEDLTPTVDVDDGDDDAVRLGQSVVGVLNGLIGMERDIRRELEDEEDRHRSFLDLCRITDPELTDW